MKAKHIIYFSIIFYLIPSEACKEGVPTGPDIPEDPTTSTLQLGDTAH
jgi:hypothetical protein